MEDFQEIPNQAARSDADGVQLGKKERYFPFSLRNFKKIFVFIRNDFKGIARWFDPADTYTITFFRAVGDFRTIFSPKVKALMRDCVNPSE